MHSLLKQSLIISISLFYFNIAGASDRVALKDSSEVDTDDIDEVHEMLFEQSVLEQLFLKKPDIVVTPYYDHYGRAGARVVPSDGEPYYVDPYFDDPMTTNRHSDEANTSTNWRAITWGD